MSANEITKESVSRFVAGNGTVGTDAQQLTTISLEVLKHVVVRADADNANTVTVGHSEASAGDGFILAGGEQTPPIYIDDSSKVWVIGGAADQNYSYLLS